MNPNALPSTRRDNLHVPTPHRVGLLALKVGCSHLVRCRDGVDRYFTAYCRGDVLEAAKSERRELTIKVVELTTQRMFNSMEELREWAGDETSMRLRGESRLWAYWCEDAWDPQQAEKIDALEKELAGRKVVIAKLRTLLAKPESIEAFDDAKSKLTAQESAVKAAEKEIVELRNAIWGLLSDDLFEGEYPAERTVPTTAPSPTAAA